MKLPPSPSLSSLIIAVLLAAAGWLAISAFIVPEVPADVATSFDARAAHHAPAVLAQAGSHTGHHVPAVAAPVPVPAAASQTDAAAPRAAALANRALGGESEIGKGTVSTYAELNAQGEPQAIGVIYSAGALEGLPTNGSDFHHCFDKNGDGAVDRATECLHSYEFVLPLPDAVARRKDVPFKWVLLNWNPHGHIPPGVYDTPHFDVHFYMEPIAKIFALRSGPCGPELMNCDQFAIAKRPVPSNYVHTDFKDVDGVVPAMGNHLVDLTGPEFQKQPFTRSWIFGAYDGRIIFYEEMVAHRHLVQQPQSCAPIKQPKGWATAGFYPTVSCLRHDATTGETTVSMERFTFRPASAPEP
jgi:hypothetical protein